MYIPPRSLALALAGVLLMLIPWETDRPLPAVANLLFMPPQTGEGQGTKAAADTGLEPVGPPASEDASERQVAGKADADTRLLINIAGGVAVGLLIIVAVGVFYFARGKT
jgi:hypothetical protein